MKRRPWGPLSRNLNRRELTAVGKAFHRVPQYGKIAPDRLFSMR
jgi:hypothetical protein